MEQETIKRWFNEAYQSGLHYQKTKREEFILYKGFRLTLIEGMYSILNTRESDYYDQVREKYVLVLRKNGFVRGSRMIAYRRDLKRVDMYTKKLKDLYKAFQTGYQNLLFDDNTKYHNKKIGIIESKIQDTIVLLATYKARVKQYEQQYINKL